MADVLLRNERSLLTQSCMTHTHDTSRYLAPAHYAWLPDVMTQYTPIGGDQTLTCTLNRVRLDVYGINLEVFK